MLQSTKADSPFCEGIEVRFVDSSLTGIYCSKILSGNGRRHDRGGHGRGRYSGGRGGRGNGGHQNGRGDGQTGTSAAQHGRGNGQTGDRAHYYAFPGRSEAETSDAVITGNLLVYDCTDSVLFDPGSTFSYVSSSFATGLNLYCELLDMPIRVSTLVGESVIVEKVYRSCLVTFMGSNTHVDLVIL